MESVGRFCFYYDKGKCFFLRNDPSECNLCPNFISFKKESISYSDSEKLPINYFDLKINKGDGDTLQQTLLKFEE